MEKLIKKAGELLTALNSKRDPAIGAKITAFLKEVAEAEPETFGYIVPSNKLTMTTLIGEAGDGQNDYELLVNTGSGAPMLQSVQTKKYYTLPWQEIIYLAERHGLSDPKIPAPVITPKYPENPERPIPVPAGNPPIAEAGQ